MRGRSILVLFLVACGPGPAGGATDATSEGSTSTTEGSGDATGWPTDCVGNRGGRAPCYRFVRAEIDPLDGIRSVIDLDGNGLSDLYDRANGMWLGLGRAGFGSRLPLPPPGKGGALLGDLNGDGLGDIVASVHGREMAIYFGTPQDVMFTETVTFEVPTDFEASMGDFDGDGDLDVLTWDHDHNADLTPVQRLENDGAGSLIPGAIEHLPGITEPYPGPVADVDGDGADDIVGVFPLTGDFDHTKEIVYGGADALDGPHLLPGSNAAVPYLADLDGDGKADLVYSRPGSIEVWHTVGRNDFEPWGVTDLFTPLDEYTTGSVAWADVDEDGVLDLLVLGVDLMPNGRELALFVLFDAAPSGFAHVERIAIPMPCPSNLRDGSLHIASVDNDHQPDLLLTVHGNCDSEWESTLVALIP